MTQAGVTATCPHCNEELPDDQTPPVCELCGAAKATVVLASLVDSNSSMFCEPCIAGMYAKAFAEAIRGAEEGT